MQNTQETMLIDSTYPDNIRIAVLDSNNAIHDLLMENSQKRSIRQNIYLGTVVRVEHALQAAFVDYGGDKNGFLPFSEIHPDYYQIPSSDIEKLKETLGKRRGGSANVEDEDFEDHDDEMHAEDQDFDDENSNSKNEKSSQYNIQEVIKKGKNVLVQVLKDERGNKGASLTTYISLAGRCCVFMPNSPIGIGVSKKISNPDDRRRIIEVANSFGVEAETGLVIRTAGASVEESELRRDYEYLISLWNKLRERTLSSKVLSLIYEEGSVIRQAMRDNYHSGMSSVTIEGADGYNEAMDCINDFAPQDKKKIVKYTGKVPLFYKYNVESQIEALLKERVDLPSGGYLVINQTEALVAIDVNSGKATAEKNVEETAIMINKEAAHEIARQVRLRDLGGLIIVDFIDMISIRNRKIIEGEIRNAFSTDKARVQFARISMFGLLEFSRQRTRASISEMSMVVCPTCQSAGRIRTTEFVVEAILRAVDYCVKSKEVLSKEHIEVKCPREVFYTLKSMKKNPISELASQNGVNINLSDGGSSSKDHFVIYKTDGQKAKDSKKTVLIDSAESSEMPTPVACVFSKQDKFTGASDEGNDRGDRNDRSDRNDRGGRGGRRFDRDDRRGNDRNDRGGRRDDRGSERGDRNDRGGRGGRRFDRDETERQEENRSESSSYYKVGRFVKQFGLGLSTSSSKDSNTADRGNERGDRNDRGGRGGRRFDRDDRRGNDRNDRGDRGGRGGRRFDRDDRRGNDRSDRGDRGGRGGRSSAKKGLISSILGFFGKK